MDRRSHRAVREVLLKGAAFIPVFLSAPRAKFSSCSSEIVGDCPRLLLRSRLPWFPTLTQTRSTPKPNPKPLRRGSPPSPSVSLTSHPDFDDDMEADADAEEDDEMEGFDLVAWMQFSNLLYMHSAGQFCCFLCL